MKNNLTKREKMLINGGYDIGKENAQNGINVTRDVIWESVLQQYYKMNPKEDINSVRISVEFQPINRPIIAIIGALMQILDGESVYDVSHQDKINILSFLTDHYKSNQQ